MSKMLSRLFPCPIRGKQTSSSKKAHESMANEKSPPNPYPNPELKRPWKPQPSPEQWATSFWALLHCSSCSLSFLSNKSYFLYRLWPINQLPYKPVLWPVKARTLNTGPQHFKPACNMGTTSSTVHHSAMMPQGFLCSPLCFPT
jgi:hypothetical protein